MSQYGEQIAKLREFARDQAEQAAEYSMRTEYLERENARLKRRLDRIYRSWTWRAGRVVLFPYHVVSWLLGRFRHERR